MNIEVTGPSILFTIPILGGINITQTVLSSAVVTILLCCSFVYLGRGLTKRPGKRQVLVEKGILMLYNTTCQAMGANNAAEWFPFICTIFLSSVCGSLIGMTGFLRSTTADWTTPLTWALMVSVVIWRNNIKANGFLGWLKGFTEPIVVMTPMNLISEVAQPVAMSFRQFGNVAGGGVITSILYAALSMLSSLVLNAIASNGVAMAIVVLVLGVGLLIWNSKNKKTWRLIVGILFILLGIFGALQALGILSGVPILSLGIPAVLSLYFDIFSGFVQAFVFSLLSMIYIAGSCPEPETAEAAQ